MQQVQLFQAYVDACLGKDDERAQATGPHSSGRRYHALPDLRRGALPKRMRLFMRVQRRLGKRT